MKWRAQSRRVNDHFKHGRDETNTRTSWATRRVQKMSQDRLDCLSCRSEPRWTVPHAMLAKATSHASHPTTTNPLNHATRSIGVRTDCHPDIGSRIVNYFLKQNVYSESPRAQLDPIAWNTLSADLRDTTCWYTLHVLIVSIVWLASCTAQETWLGKSQRFHSSDHHSRATSVWLILIREELTHVSCTKEILDKLSEPEHRQRSWRLHV